MNTRKPSITKSQLIKIACLLTGLAAIWYWRAELQSLFVFISDRDAIVAFLQGYQAWGPIVLSVILAAQVFLAIIPGHAVIVAGGYIYGFVLGVLITQTSTVIASQLAYLLARRAGRPFVNRMAPAHVIDKWNRLAEKQGALFFFFAFILPIFPNDLMCFIAGLSSIKARDFFVANFLGRLPCAIFVTLIGSHGFELPIQVWIVIGLTMLGLCLSWKRLSRLMEDRILPVQTANC